MTGYTPLFKFHFVIRWHSDEIPLALHVLNNVPIFVEAEGWRRRTYPLGCVCECGRCCVLPPRMRNYRRVSVGCETLRHTVATLSFHIVIKILSLWGSLFWQMRAVWYGILFKSDSRCKEIWTFHKRNTAMSRNHYVGHYSSCFLSSGIHLA